MKTSVIIAAAGVGTRFDENTPKQFAKLGDKEMIVHTIAAFQNSDKIDSIVVATHIDWFSHVKKLVEDNNFTKVTDVIIGGKTRQDSVGTALKTEVVKESELLLTHDAARPFVSLELIDRIIEEVEDYGAVVPYTNPGDTLKEHRASSVVKTLDRSKIALAQTPQAFWTDVFITAHDRARDLNVQATDDAALVEMMGYKVQLVAGEAENIKITTPFDLYVAEAIIRSKA